MAFDSDLQALTALVEAVRTNTDEVRMMKLVMMDVRDALTPRPAPEQLALGAAATNGHANGHALATTSALPAVDVDKLGNPRVEGVRYEDRKTPCYIARITRGGRRLYVSVALDTYGGAGDAYRYALIALKCFKGEDVAKNMTLLPKRLRHKVEDELSPE